MVEMKTGLRRLRQARSSHAWFTHLCSSIIKSRLRPELRDETNDEFMEEDNLKNVCSVHTALRGID